jgi:Fuc2NAc and GlcNAc transferase
VEATLCVARAAIAAGVRYVIGVIALATAHEAAVTVWIWLIPGGVFVIDATVTLVRRLVRGERFF